MRPRIFPQGLRHPAGRLAGTGALGDAHRADRQPANDPDRRSSNLTCRTSSRRCGATARAGRRPNTAWRSACGAGRAIVQPCALPDPPAGSPNHADAVESPLRISIPRQWCARRPGSGNWRALPPLPSPANGPLTSQPMPSRPRVERSRLRPIRRLFLRSEAVRPTGDDSDCVCLQFRSRTGLTPLEPNR